MTRWSKLARAHGRTTRARALTGLLAAAAVLATMLLGVAPAGARVGPRQVTVTRDRAGIPHITASNFRALGYGEGYAFAQDNLCTFADDIVTLNGQRSQYFGPTGLAINYSAGVSDANLNSDLYWRYVKASGLIQHELSAPPPLGPLPQVRDLYAGFVQGYNAYLRSGKLRDPRCKGKAWVRPITLTDMFLRGEQVVTKGAAAQFIGGLVGAVPPTLGAARAATANSAESGSPDVAALNAQLGGGVDPTRGSNGIGLGARDTRAHTGMVLANPHFPWRGTERFWMAQLTVPGAYNMEGGTLEGFPLVGIGFNRHIAWTHTVSTSRRFALYQLKLVPGDPRSYLVDGKAVKMGQVTVSVSYGRNRVTHTFYTTRWGVVVNVPAAHYAWSTSTAYALYDSVATSGPRAANMYLRMGQATSVQNLFSVESKFLAIPTFNTVAADDRGNAYYGDVGSTPNITSAKIRACLPSGLPQVVFAQARVVTLDGSRSACATGNDAGTPVKGIFNASHLPHLFRRDYVENSNDSYWLANPSSPQTGFSPVIGLTGTVQGLRTRLGNLMIAQRVAGTDHLGAPKFTIATLQAMWQSDRSLLAELVLTPLVSACRAHPSAIATNGTAVNLAAACSALATYNKTGSENASGGWLFSEWNLHFNTGQFYATPFDPARPLSTPSGLDTANPDTLRALADAVLEMKAHGFGPAATYGQVQHATRGSSRIPIHGCDSGCFNAIYGADDLSTSPTSVDPYGEVYDGSSLVMTTELTRRGPSSQGILTYSQASDPTSPWFANMTRLYSQKRWVKLAYTPAALRAGRPLPTLVLRAP